MSEPKLVQGEDYVVRVQNYAAAEPYEGTINYLGPDPVVKRQAERWTLLCRSGSAIAADRQIFIERGEQLSIDLLSACS